VAVLILGGWAARRTSSSDEPQDSGSARVWRSGTTTSLQFPRPPTTGGLSSGDAVGGNATWGKVDPDELPDT